MANIQNLKPFTSDQSREKAVENGRKGGIASGKARRDKRAMNKLLVSILEVPATPELITKINKRGICLDENSSNKQVVAATLIACAMDGDIKATKLLMELIGEYTKQVDVNADVKDTKKELMELLKQKKSRGGANASKR